MNNFSRTKILKWSSFLNEDGDIIFFLDAENYSFKSYTETEQGLLLENNDVSGRNYLLEHTPKLVNNYIHIAELSLTGDLTKEHIVYNKNYKQ